MKRKIISLLLPILLIVNVFPMTVFATPSVGSTADDSSVGEDVIQNQITEYSEIKTSNAASEVYLTVEDSDLIVSLPTTLIIGGVPNENGEYTGNYSVGVEGDMSGDKVVTVEPENYEVTLHQTGKNDRTATITQDQIDFDTNDFKDKTVTNGNLTAVGLTAGAWNGEVNFKVNVKRGFAYYSSVELAANDANSLTTANADISGDDIRNAVASLSIVDGKANMRLLKDSPNTQSFSLNENTLFNLCGNTITFNSGQYLTFNKDLSVYNGNIISTNSRYIVYGSSANKGAFCLNNVNMTSTINSITSASSFLDLSTSNNTIMNSTMLTNGTGNANYNSLNVILRNDNASTTMTNININNNVTSCKAVKLIQMQGALTLTNNKFIIGRDRSNIVKPSSEATSALSDYCVVVSSKAVNANLVVNGGHYDSNIGIVYTGETDADRDCGNVAFGLVGTNTKAIFKDEAGPLYIHGGNTAVTTGSVDVDVYGGTFVSPNHGGMYLIAGNSNITNIYGGSFYCENNDNITAYGGIYVSGNSIVNINNAKIKGGRFGLRTKVTSGYTSDAKVTIENSTIYGSQQVFSVSQGSLIINNGTVSSWDRSDLPEVELCGGTCVDNRTV